MSERILRALMQLFAIIAKVDEVSDDIDSLETVAIQSTKGKQIIEGFLKSELSSSDVNKYLNIFDELLNQTRGKLYSKKGGRKRTSLQAVKVLRICSQINEELTQRQKFIVLVRIFEFIHSDNARTEKELDFITTAADAFNISKEEFNDLREFIEYDGENLPDLENHFYYTPKSIDYLTIAKSEVVHGLDKPIHIVNIKSVKALFFKYYGKDELIINGQITASDKTHLFNVGSTIRTNKISQLYYSNLVTRISDFDRRKSLSFKAENILHTFATGGIGIRKMCFQTNSGNMVGIMGGSGTGKTTLMNIMNGKTAPSFGQVLINNIDLHKNNGELEGIIGSVNQSDLLIEELTVFENLFFAAKLSLGKKSAKHLTKKVVELLSTLGLYEARNLRVGSPLEKVISGGQRKRLNIALELIREPQILFVDEPTSGLSSRDSENIMDLLKELSLKGTLVFVVIHQPSSNIFKLFDRLLIMDVGGYLVYDGIPLNAMVHFKTHSFQGNAHERECGLCGNVTPEQIFNIIDGKIVDEFGNETRTRKRSAEDWHKLYSETRDEYSEEFAYDEIKEEPEINAVLPKKWTQFKSYLKRDFLSKLANKQYLIVNGLVAPSLAIVLSFFIKYFSWSEGMEEYHYFFNENIPQYIFISVIVSIFLGLTVAAEEINKDKMILERERFLNLSHSSYLLSKTTILFSISAIQALFFVLIGNSLLEIRGMYLEYWLILFSTGCLSNLVGLNISSAFNSAKVIYIIVPLLIIPQLLFSGVIVKFDKLHPSLSNATKVPWIGNMMASRWAYEAIAVEQASNNQLETYYFDHKVNWSEAKWKKDFWVPEMKKQVNILVKSDGITSPTTERAKVILTNEIQKEEKKWNYKDPKTGKMNSLSCEGCIETLHTEKQEQPQDFDNLKRFIDIIRLQSTQNVNRANDSIQKIISELGTENYRALQLKYSNESLQNLLRNKAESNKLIIDESEIHQNSDPIYHTPEDVGFFSSHFYAPKKKLFGKSRDTYWVNLALIWLISLITYIALYFDWLKGIISFGKNQSSRFRSS